MFRYLFQQPSGQILSSDSKPEITTDRWKIPPYAAAVTAIHSYDNTGYVNLNWPKSLVDTKYQCADFKDGILTVAPEPELGTLIADVWRATAEEERDMAARHTNSALVKDLDSLFSNAQKAGLAPAAPPAPADGAREDVKAKQEDVELAKRTLTKALHTQDDAALTNETEHPLYPVFMAVIKQVTSGKGERHGGATIPFLEQPWKMLADQHGRGFLTGQSAKKIGEAPSKPDEAFETEILGGIAYAAMAYLHHKERK